MYLAKALLRRPQLLILDNPFLGLDVEARQILQGIINELITIHKDSFGEGFQIIVICNYPHEIPSSIKNRLLIDNFKIREINNIDAISAHYKPDTEGYDASKLRFPTPPAKNFEYAVRMDHVKVEYENSTVLDNITWHVKHGEKWVLGGENGSGKSTLLSLVFGDHPQAYANKVEVFDRKRGNGDSIWDIKNRIGYVSPELHLYFTDSISNYILATDGLKVRADFADDLFEFYGISHLKKQDFQQTSTANKGLFYY